MESKAPTYYIDPYQILKIKPEEASSAKSQFRELIGDASFVEKIDLTIAYEILSDKHIETYQKEGNRYKFEVPNDDIFRLALVNNLYQIREIVNKKHSLLHKTDKRKRDLFYIALRSGYNELFDFLIQFPIKLCEKYTEESSYLHVASFYGHYELVQRLLCACIPNSIQNKYKNLAIEEAKTDKIKSILKAANDNSLYAAISRLATIKYLHTFHEIYCDHSSYKGIAFKKFTCMRPPEWNEEFNQSKIYFHGTKLEYIKSIIKYGLKPAGAKAGDKDLIPQSDHIPFKSHCYGFEDFAKGVFLSPSIFYAADKTYAEEVTDLNGDVWSIVLECRIRKENMKGTAIPSTTPSFVAKLNEKVSSIEYRVEIPTEESNDGIISNTYYCVNVSAIILVSTKFRSNLSDADIGIKLASDIDKEDFLFK